MSIQKKTTKKVHQRPVMLPGFETDQKSPLVAKSVTEESNRSATPTSLSHLLKSYQPKQKNKYVSREFQDYGYRLAMELGDESHASMYIKLAKTLDRGLLESARSFVIDSQARSKGKLFMWKLKQLKEEKGEREKVKSLKVKG